MANQLAATTRTEFGKGAARRARRAGLIPAVLYGHGTDPVHISLPGQETFLVLREANVLLEIAIDGAKPVMALPKQIQRDVITGAVDHVDLLLVKKGEKVTVEVAILLVGEAERGALVMQDLQSLKVHVPATHIPSDIEVSIDGLVIGDQIFVRDIKLPADVEALDDAELLVVNVVAPAVEVEAEEAAEGGAEEA